MIAAFMRVTFDTNTLAAVVSPESAQPPMKPADAAKVRDGLQADIIEGFFSEGLVAIEGIENEDRAEVLGRTRLERRVEDCDKNRITLTLAVQHHRNPLHPKFLARIKAALEIGMRALRDPARVGALRVHNDDGAFFAPEDSILELLARMDKVNELAAAIGARGLRHARAQLLGVRFTERTGVCEPELWCQGLLRAEGSGELKQVIEACAEWADGTAWAPTTAMAMISFAPKIAAEAQEEIQFYTLTTVSG